MYHQSVIQPSSNPDARRSSDPNTLKLQQLIKQPPSKIIFKNQQFPQDSIIINVKQDKICRIDQVRHQDLVYILKRINSTKVSLSEQLKSNTEYQMKACMKFMNKNSDPFVITYHEIWETPMYYNILMEWCNSQTLEEYLLKDCIDNDRSQLCVVFMLEILYGLTACHQRGITMHRDLKPSNVFVTHRLTQLRVKIGDFGVCTDNKFSKNFQGTNLYLAPQVFAIKNKWMPYKFARQYGYDSNCDMWSLGMICYQLYSGLTKNMKLSFPFIENIEKFMINKQETIKYTRLFYEECVKLEGIESDPYRKTYLVFREWKNLSEANKKRMKIYKILINNMLWPNPLGRISSFGLYQLIKQNRTLLFSGVLKNHPIILKFDQYHKKQQKFKSSGGQIHNMSTLLV